MNVKGHSIESVFVVFSHVVSCNSQQVQEESCMNVSSHSMVDFGVRTAGEGVTAVLTGFDMVKRLLTGLGTVM